MRKRFLLAIGVVISITFVTTMLSSASTSRSSRSVDVGFVSPEVCPEPIDTAQLTVGGQEVIATTTGRKPKTLVKTANRDRSVQTGSSSYITGVEHGAMLTATSPAVAVTTCRAAQIDTWFVGGSGVVESQTSLVMINQSAAPAAAEITAWTASGPVAPSTLTVPALGSAAISLDRYAASSIVTRVRALSGRIGVYLMDQRFRGLTKLGGDYVASQPAPERKSVILGVLGKSASRLRLVAPGTQDAVIRIDVAFGKDRYTPAGLDSVRVKAGTVVDFPLNLKSSTGYGAVIIDSDVPVVAGVFVPVMQGNQQKDFTWLSPSRPLQSATLAINAPATDDGLLIYTEEESTSLNATDINGKGLTTFVAKPITLTPLKKTLRLQPNEKIYAAQVVKSNGGLSIIPLNPTERAQQRLAPIADLSVLAPR